MSTIVVERDLPGSADDAWALLEDVGNAHSAFPGVLLDSHLDTDGVRTVTFADGPVIREAILGVDPERRRIAYSVLNGRFSIHAASMQVVPGPDGASARLVWISDFLPEAAAPLVQGLMERGGDAFVAAVPVRAV